MFIRNVLRIILYLCLSLLLTGITRKQSCILNKHCKKLHDIYYQTIKISRMILFHELKLVDILLGYPVKGCFFTQKKLSIWNPFVRYIK